MPPKDRCGPLRQRLLRPAGQRIYRPLRGLYPRWVNPFNGRPQYVAFDHLRVAVFWSKNPLPLLPLLPQVEARELAWYLEFTLNDYEAEGWGANLPPLARRIGL